MNCELRTKIAISRDYSPSLQGMKLLRTFVVVILTLNTLGSTLLVPLIYIDFNLRRDYIAEVLCIKKEEPITVCGGKCYLADQMKKVTQHQQEEATPVHRYLQLSFFNQPITRLSFDSYNHGITVNYFRLESQNPISSFHKDIFHPPRIA